MPYKTQNKSMKQQDLNKSILLIGCGRQAQALVFDLAKFGRHLFSHLILADRDLGQIQKLMSKVNTALKKDGLKAPSFQIHALDASRKEKLNQFVKKIKPHLVISASHYSLNPIIAQVAVKHKSHYADLGGYLESSLKIKKLGIQAKKNNIFLAPDLGLAPGMANILAGWGLKHKKPPLDITIYCGGLPEKPVGPLGYKLVFSVDGLWGTHFGDTVVLKNHQPQKIKTLTEIETIEFDRVGRLEAFITSGALAAAPWTLKGNIRNYVYKTLRYPGYAEKIKFLDFLGLTETKPRQVGKTKLIPRELLSQLFREKLQFPEVSDLMALRVKIGDTTLDVLDYADKRLGFSAMERTTGFSASIAIQMLLKQSRTGFVQLETDLDPDIFIQELEKRNIKVKKY